MKNISKINPAITENMEYLIVKVPVIDIKVGVSLLTRCTLHFASSSSNAWLTFQAKNNVRNAPASTAIA